MNMFLFAIQHDWFVLLPIVLCLIWVVGVTLERYQVYQKNKRDIVTFIQRLQRELQRENLQGAEALSSQLGGILGEVAEEGLRILAENRHGFNRSFDITVNLALRRLEKYLDTLGTVATIAPYLGLFGTVVRILFTFGEMAKGGGQQAATEIMFGIGSALIATAAGLLIAITAVVLNNQFRGVVSKYEDDFQLLKLLFLSVIDRQSAMPVAAVAPPQTYVPHAQGAIQHPSQVSQTYPSYAPVSAPAQSNFPNLG
ncbi:MAG: MotA/TolQ/ExbB proton channel family protein [Vampirovibrionales bacterium]